VSDSLQLGHERVPAIADELDLSDEAREQAVAYAERADYDYPINRSPDVVAAASIYLVASLINEKRTQEEVATAAEVSIPSIRDAYQELAEQEGFRFGSRREKASTDPNETTWVTMRKRLRRWIRG
jgi:transcription initiation factor TFIIIB Brf1 subunit/transcription initiation factor TFIIB